MAFYGDIPKNKIILHDDSADHFGSFRRNWVCDLKCSSQGDNVQDFYNNKKRIMNDVIEDIAKLCCADDEST
jgi:hypothetical protein